MGKKQSKLNFIKINGVTLPDPSEVSYGLQDISESDAGRDKNTSMYKGYIGRVRTYDLSWNNIDEAEASEILSAVKPEYFTGYLWDVQNGRYETRTYYVGDRQGVFYMWTSGEKIMQKVSFRLIERQAHDD